MTRTYFIIILIYLPIGCTITSDPDRPQNVPASAVWSGGPDGGNWFDCDSEKNSAYNNCTVYADVTGAVIETGKYQLKVEKRAATKNELQYAYYSVGEINLRNNMLLTRIDE